MCKTFTGFFGPFGQHFKGLKQRPCYIYHEFAQANEFRTQAERSQNSTLNKKSYYPPC